MFDGAADTYDQSGVPFFGPIAAGLVELADHDHRLHVDIRYPLART